MKPAPKLGVVKVIVPPAQIAAGVVLAFILGTGVAGNAFTTTVVVAIALVQPATVTVKL